METQAVTVQDRTRRTLKECEAVYPNEWVLMVEIEGSGLYALTGIVVAHSRNRDAIHAANGDLRRQGVRELGNFWTGKMFNPRRHVEILDDQPGRTG